jgi:hypothetical protein
VVELAIYRLYLRNELYAKLVEKAIKEGKTVGRFINDILEKAVKEG